MIYLIWLGLLWLGFQLMTYLSFKNCINIKSVIDIGHSMYRSFMCGMFFLSGIYLCMNFIMGNNFRTNMSEQIILCNISWAYMVFDLLVIFVQKLCGSVIRIDLILHHIMALIALYLCGLYEYKNIFIWSMISVSEVLSIWSGVGLYAVHTSNYCLANQICISRALTLLFGRIPWWVIVLYCTTYVKCQSIFFWYAIGIKLIICLDIYWLSECLKRLIIYQLNNSD